MTTAARHGRTWLRWGALLTGMLAVLHLAIIAGGPDWYRFFGAGERMARLAERGSRYPAALTMCIASLLAVSALYGLSGADAIRRLPALRPMLSMIAAVFLARGLLGIPAILLLQGPYFAELRARLPFMIVTSIACVALGVCYAAGAARH